MGLLDFISKRHRDKDAQSGEAEEALERANESLEAADEVVYDAKRAYEALNYELRVKNHVSQRFERALRGRT